MTLRITLFSIAAAALLSACGGGETPTKDIEVSACNCHLALEKSREELKSIVEPCKTELKNEAFAQEYARCKIADMKGVSVDDVPAPTPKEKLELKAVSTGNFMLHTDRSKANWTGGKVTGKNHYGTVNVKSGSVSFEGETVTAARIVMDMTSIANRDLEDEEQKAKLIGHLRSADFFNVDKYPEAVFELTEPATLVDNRTDLVGELTVRGKTHPLTIQGATLADLGKFVAITGIAKFDRTKYGVNFGSGLSGAVGDAIIKDDIAVNFSLTALPAEEVQ